LGNVASTSQDETEILDVHRFGQKIVGPGPDSGESVLLLALSGDHDGFEIAVKFEKLTEGGQAFFGRGGVGWKPKVEEDGERLLRGTLVECGLPVPSEGNFVIPGQCPPELRANFLVVIHDQ
jgi:hypothetical protein